MRIPKNERDFLGAINCLIGPDGEYFCELGGIERVFCQGLFWACYAHKKMPKRDTVQKYLRGTARFPRKILKILREDSGEEKLRQGVDRLVEACMCMDALLMIQDQMAAYIADTDMAQGIKDKISSYYVSSGASRAQIEAYLTCVMVCLVPMM